ALIMLAGISYGSMYGGSTTSILVNVPGEAASVVTTIDGYRLARKGRAGAAPALAAIAPFLGGGITRGGGARRPSRAARRRDRLVGGGDIQRGGAAARRAPRRAGGAGLRTRRVLRLRAP